MQLIDSKDLKKHILTNYDQVNVFATYLEIPDTDINYCLENKNNKISNPRRDDRNPSLSFMYVIDNKTSEFKLKMYDWADPYYRGDCFDLVGIVRHLNPIIGSEFITICNDIIITMKDKTVNKTVKSPLANSKQEPFTNIHIEPRLWNSKDIEIWNNFGLPFNEYIDIVFPLQHSFISNFCNYTYDEKDPGYAWISGYYDGKTLYTLYFPLRGRHEKNHSRFIKNNRFYPLENIHELRSADILTITKAFKEKLLIKRLLPRIKTKHTIQVTNFTSESIVLSNNFVLKLYDIYPTIVTNLDFDYTGLVTSRKLKRNYGMIRFVPTNGKYNTYDFGGKDLCEIYYNKGELYCSELLQEAYDYLAEQIEFENEKANLF